MWRRRDYTYESAHSTDSRRDLDHAFSDEPEFFVFRGNATTICYGQGPKRRDDEWCERDVGDIRCFRGDSVFYWTGHCSRRRHGHDHGDKRVTDCDRDCNSRSGGVDSFVV